ncbi:hypothetical protein XACN24_14605 [Xanthomonas albilineans]|uniref:hypothetical protein n=1 Tax=Xanthomonas albilineans TaxID=29447 RepID=UPI000ABB9CF6|nr:hypothetical protein [Xanthomonas albilineans]
MNFLASVLLVHGLRINNVTLMLFVFLHFASSSDIVNCAAILTFLLIASPGTGTAAV